MKLKLAIGAAAICFGLALSAGTASANHAFAAEFDANKPVEMTGTVTKMEWINPHVWLHMDVKKPDGTVENWPNLEALADGKPYVAGSVLT